MNPSQTAIMSLEEPRPRERWSGSAPTGGASARPKTFSDATFAAAISTRGITYGFWITKARCRTRRKIKRNSATGSSARARGACEFGRRNVLVSSRRRMTTLLLLIQHRAEVARVELS
jgi:hypothetical protein